MEKEKEKKNVLMEAGKMLSEPSKNTKRNILIAFNFVFIAASFMHLIVQLVETGTLPDFGRDIILFPLLIIINSISVIYNIKVLKGKTDSFRWKDRYTAWSSVGIALLLALLIVHVNPNKATSIIVDFGFSIIMIFIVGTIIGKKAAVVWFIVASLSLFTAYENVGTNFEYYLMTNTEVQQFNKSLEEGNPEAEHKLKVLKENHLEPLPISLFVGVEFLFMIILLLAVYYESNMISKVLRVIPSVIKKISIASDEKHKLENENMRMGYELDVAQTIQETLLPNENEFNQVDYLEISARMDAADEVGGDFYEILPQDDNSVILAIGDVTDHGLQSGLVMLMVQSTIRTILDRDGKNDAKNISLTKALNRINTIMYRNIHNRMQDQRNLTMYLAHLNENSVTICGQHENVLRYNAEKKEVEIISTNDLGIYIGMIENIEPHVNELKTDFLKNDILLMYTDGLTEAENPEGEFFGEEGLTKLFEKYASLDAKAMVTAIFDDLYHFVGSDEILDDISLMIVKRKDL